MAEQMENLTLNQVQLTTTAGDYYPWDTASTWVAPAYYYFCHHPMGKSEMEQAFNVVIALMDQNLIEPKTVKEFIAILKAVADALK